MDLAEYGTNLVISSSLSERCARASWNRSRMRLRPSLNIFVTYPASRQNALLCRAGFHKQAAFDDAVCVHTERLQHKGLCTNACVVHLLATKELTLLSKLRTSMNVVYGKLTWHVAHFCWDFITHQTYKLLIETHDIDDVSTHL